MPKTPIAGILFDKDGTLLDFQKTWGKVVEQVLDQLAPDRETWNRMAEAGGYDAARGCFLPGSAVVASATSEIADLWASFLPDLGARAIERVLDDAAMEALADPDSLYPAVPDLPAVLADLRAAGYVLGVATHDSERAARLQCPDREIGRRFHQTHSAQMVGLLVADRVGGHVRHYEVGRSAQRVEDRAGRGIVHEIRLQDGYPLDRFGRKQVDSRHRGAGPLLADHLAPPAGRDAEVYHPARISQ